MSEYERCADLCDDRGFARQAALLREVGAGRCRAYVVEESRRAAEALGWDEPAGPEPESRTTRTVLLNRDAADRFARGLTARALRGMVVPRGIDPAYLFEYLTGLPRDDFCSRIGEILGRPYRLPGAGEPLIPESATDALLLRIVARLNLELFTVAAVDIAP